VPAPFRLFLRFSRELLRSLRLGVFGFWDP